MTHDLKTYAQHNPTIIIGGSVLIGSLLISVTLLYIFKISEISTQKISTQPLSAQTGSVKITLGPNTPYLGNNNAKVTVVEYADYKCPLCEKFYNSVMSDLQSKYINTGKIKFVYQDFAFIGSDSNTAAEAAHCAADQNKFWQYNNYLFSHQGQESSAWASSDHQKEFAVALGLNIEQFNNCLDSGKYKQEVLDETAAGRSYGVLGTPTVFVNGNIIVGAQPAQQFEQVIDAALKNSS